MSTAGIHAVDFPGIKASTGGCASFETAASRPPQDYDKGLMPDKNIRHPEEHPAAARLEGRTAPVRAAIGRVLILLVVVLALAGCGKKGNPQPPPDEPNTYPRVYPSA